MNCLMKAYRITSTEYHANTPSVFLFVNGEYLGELTYPRLRNYPQDVDYWRTATCADADRYFHIEEVEVSTPEIEVMKRMHDCIDESKGKLKPYSGYRPFATKEEREADYQSDLEAEAYNRPFEREIIRLHSVLEKYISNLKTLNQ